MGTALIARLGALTQNGSLCLRAAADARSITALLRDPGSGLLRHGYDASSKTRSCCSWGRANGWALMALADLLVAANTGCGLGAQQQQQQQQPQPWRSLTQRHRRSAELELPPPPSPPANADWVAAVADVERELLGHARAMVRVQHPTDGRWHQVLDANATFLETSVTAMALYAMISGIESGALTRAEFDRPVRAAWRGLLRAIAVDGTVSGVSCGTNIQTLRAQYEVRPTPYLGSGPGLGAVVRAAVAMDRYTNS